MPPRCARAIKGIALPFDAEQALSVLLRADDAVHRAFHSSGDPRLEQRLCSAVAIHQEVATIVDG